MRRVQFVQEGGGVDLLARELAQLGHCVECLGRRRLHVRELRAPLQRSAPPPVAARPAKGAGRCAGQLLCSRAAVISHNRQRSASYKTSSTLMTSSTSQHAGRQAL